MSDLFGDLETDLPETGDYLGGRVVFATGAYPATIKMAFAGKSDSGARFLDVTFNLEDDREYNERVYYTNAKGENFFVKDGKKNKMPGFVLVEELALLATGNGPNKFVTEERQIEVWDNTEKAKVRKATPVVVSLLDKEVILGLVKSVEDKTKKTDRKDDKGKPIYAATGETMEQNSIKKVFYAKDGRTVTEIKNKKEEATFIVEWRKRFHEEYVEQNAKGKKTAKKSADDAAPGEANTDATAAADSLFGSD